MKSPANKCRVITESINCLSSLFKDRMPSADDLFPIMVYLMLGSNPQFISLNLRFIETYLTPSRKLNKDGYILASLSTALSFIDRIDAKSLLEGKLKVKDN